jgi:hypothetical protein
LPLFKKMKGEKNAHPAQGLRIGDADRARLETVGFYVLAGEEKEGKRREGKTREGEVQGARNATQRDALSLHLRRRRGGSWVERGRGPGRWRGCGAHNLHTQYSTVLKTDAVQYSYKCSVSKIGEVFRADSAR